MHAKRMKNYKLVDISKVKIFSKVLQFFSYSIDLKVQYFRKQKKKIFPKT